MAVHVELVPVGEPAPGLVDGLAEDLTALGFDIDIAAARPMPPRFLDRRRGQYRAESLLAALGRPRRGADLLLAVTDCDLFAPGLNFVFGIAGPETDTAVVSLHRLGIGAGPELVRQRAFKEAVHELGHALGLPHCRASRCVMQFSNSLADTDRKHPFFCDRCFARLGVFPANGPQYSRRERF